MQGNEVTMQHTVLIVDDDKKIVNLLEAYFQLENFITSASYDGQEALLWIREKHPDIVILDLMLPQISGLEICRQIRMESNVPIIMLTARDEEADKLIGLEIGADDYVTKPFSPREVVTRAKVILRRSKNVSNADELIRVGNISIDIAKHIVSKGKFAIELTPTEFKILELLAANPNQVFTRLQIVEQVQGYAFDGYERTIDAHIKNLRRKLKDSQQESTYIQTVYGIGYKLASDYNV